MSEEANKRKKYSLDLLKLLSQLHIVLYIDIKGMRFFKILSSRLLMSPLKTRSAHRKACAIATSSIVPYVDSTDLGVLRGIKALARSRP